MEICLIYLRSMGGFTIWRKEGEVFSFEIPLEMMACIGFFVCKLIL